MRGEQVIWSISAFLEGREREEGRKKDKEEGKEEGNRSLM